jgi:hypothetical protein
MTEQEWRFAPIREPWYIALARAVPDPQVEHPLAAIRAVLDDYGLQVVPIAEHLAVLLAAAREHAPPTDEDVAVKAKVDRLAAALDRISWDLDDDDPTEIARAALSAEAGDTDDC